MTNSSDWIAALQGQSAPASEVPQGWIGALQAQGDFVEGLPFGQNTMAVGRPCPDTRSDGAGPRLDAIPDPVAEAFARGKAAGLAEAKADIETAQTRQRGLRLALRALDQAAMDSLAGELAETVIALCDQAMAGFTPDSGQMQALCEAAAKRLGTAVADCTLHLHPEDAALLDADTREHWRVTPDEEIERGGLRFESADGSVSDGPSEWRRAIASAIRG